MDRAPGSARGLVLAGLWGTLPASSCDACCLLATVGGVNSGGIARMRLDPVSDLLRSPEGVCPCTCLRVPLSPRSDWQDTGWQLSDLPSPLGFVDPALQQGLSSGQRRAVCSSQVSLPGARAGGVRSGALLAC